MTKKELELKILELEGKIEEKDNKIKSLTEELDLNVSHRISFKHNDIRSSIIGVEENTIRFESHNQICILPIAANCIEIKFLK